MGNTFNVLYQQKIKLIIFPILILDALLSDLSYSHSDDSSNEKLMNDAKHKLTSTITQPKKELNIKTCEVLFLIAVIMFLT